MGTSTTPVASRWQFLDAIRGLAAIAVVFQHMLWPLSPGIATFFSTVWSPGRFGVVAFFLVSGFIVPRSLEQHGDVKAFWRARFTRLFPAYWFSLLFIGLLPVAGIASLNGADLGSLTVWIANISMLQGFAQVPEINPVAWTLGLELVLYSAISVAFVKGFLGRTWFIAGSLLAIIGVSSIVLPYQLHIRFPAGASAVFGSIIAGLTLFRWFTGKFKLAEAIAVTVLCLGVTAGSSIVNYSATRSTTDDLQPTQLCAILSVATGYLFFLLMLKARSLTFPNWILWLGKVSYSLYLLHPVALALVPYSWSPAVIIPTQLTLSIVFAWFGYECIELPSLDMAKRRLKKRELKLTKAKEVVFEQAA
ncbi:MAG: acyltransferase [Armatimonadota bacterium]